MVVVDLAVGLALQVATVTAVGLNVILVGVVLFVIITITKSDN